MNPGFFTPLLLAIVCLLALPAQAQTARAATVIQRSAPAPSPATPESRLIEVYRLTGAGQTREALQRAESLVHDHPNFQLAQLVYGDLLTTRIRPVRDFGDVPATLASGQGVQTLADLRHESQMRLKALRERPPAGTIPSQFLALSPRNRHAIAIDASRSRLYLFENTPQQLRLVADFYISVGKSGIEKMVEGDARTPLGVYFIVSNLDPKSLSDFYGSGACPSITPMCSTASAARPDVASGCTARRPTSSRARRWPLTAAWCSPTRISPSSAARSSHAPRRW